MASSALFVYIFAVVAAVALAGTTNHLRNVKPDPTGFIPFMYPLFKQVNCERKIY